MTAQFISTGWTEIRSTEDDSYAPNAIIGYVAPDSNTIGDWNAALPDLDDIMHDPQPIKRYLTASSNEVAERAVRNHYARWVAKQD
jgi:hypothetical protein